MAVIVDLEDDEAGFDHLKQLQHSLPESHSDNHGADQDNDRPNPNVNGFSAALSCYPIVSQLASMLDLNTLHSLSRTCRQFRANLLEYRDQLVRNSLHCVNEDAGTGSKLADRLRESHSTWTGNGLLSSYGRITSGKIGKCARDMVGECQRCGTVVCRNCTLKPPPPPALKGRHRRLCRTCTKAPLPSLTTEPIPRPPSSNGSQSSSPQPGPTFSEPPPVSFTSPAFQRTPCTCESIVWLCLPCGQTLRTADTTYIRGWTWRTRYSQYLGGLGTGIGEGNEGVQCGRGAACLAAKTVEQEIDCDAEALAALDQEAEKVEAEGTGRSWKGTSYMVQEIEGVGGTVKRKVKKRVTVGAVVREHEDERNQGAQFLEREIKGKARSWCAWCQRVIPGMKDLSEDRPVLGRRASSSEASSCGSSCCDMGA